MSAILPCQGPPSTALDVPTSPSPTGQRAGRRAGLGGPPRHVGQRRRPPAGADDRRLQRVRRCCL